MIKRRFNFQVSTLIMLFLVVSIGTTACSKDDVTIQEEIVQEEEEEVVVVEPNDFPRLTDTEDRFYTNNIPNSETTLQLSGIHSAADSNLLNQEIENRSNAGGGIIKITGGTYYLLDVKLRSNVHLKFDADVIIQPDLSGNTLNKNLIIFDIGNEFLVENSALTNTQQNSVDANTWFTVLIPTGDYRGVRVAEYSYAHNFQVSGIKIEDTHSVFSSIVLNLPDSNSKDEISNNGIIKDIVATNGHVGYGIIQIQAGITILCKNLDGEGGSTMRVETGVSTINMDNQLTVDDVVGRNITGRFGDGVLTFSPHRVDQGRVDVENITSINSTYAVRLAAGFLDNSGTLDNIGTFSNLSYVGNINVTGGNGAQIKSKDYPFFNCVDRQAIVDSPWNPDEESKPGKSIGVIRDNSSEASACEAGCYEVNVENINLTNDDFENGADYIINSLKINC
ncbi:Iota-carrageenase [Kordia antarctica]|uniref:Iota-carrageenase n=1 Tax=Kordia antarctica TaxID=1218801 RepID=A0A7L4ZRH8_9FLAO|nr:hypothetical protein [Kordia antarctica]QHI39255.1 Iota-carrageenase [Kordia antarctica]